MPPDSQLDPWTFLFHESLSDPLLLATLVAPFVILGVALYFRLRLTRRLTAMSTRNAQALTDNAVRWQEASARTDRMIALLTEIRDHMANIAPPAQAPKPE
jgi:hypothetical protein